MGNRTLRRLAAFALVFALIAPAAWAAPRGSLGPMLGSFWSTLWSWGTSLRPDLGSSLDPGGRGSMSKRSAVVDPSSRGSASTGTTVGLRPSNGLPGGGGGCGIADCTNDGPDSDPNGKR